MSDFDLMAISALPIALAAAWIARDRRLSGFDVCMTAAIFVAGLMFVDLIGTSMGATIVVCLPVLVLLPWALVPLPKGWVCGYDIWALMSSVAVMDMSQSPRIKTEQDGAEKGDIAEKGEG